MTAWRARTILGAAALAVVGASSACASSTPAVDTSSAPAATASASCAATPAQTEGPYFKSGSPKRSVLAGAGTPGIKLVLSGRVRSTSCKPVAGARIEIWQADSKGNYDNSGYRLRGHLFTDRNGRYRVVTIVPGLYPGRTEHIHVKVKASGGPVLTTQLYFPGVAQNDADGIFNARNLVKLTKAKPRWKARYDFAVATG